MHLIECVERRRTVGSREVPMMAEVIDVFFASLTCLLYVQCSF